MSKTQSGDERNVVSGFRAHSTRRSRSGLLAAAAVFLLYSLLQARDGLLVRPHRSVWRIVTGITVLYLLVLVVLLFQVREWPSNCVVF